MFCWIRPGGLTSRIPCKRVQLSYCPLRACSLFLLQVLAALHKIAYVAALLSSSCIWGGWAEPSCSLPAPRVVASAPSPVVRMAVCLTDLACIVRSLWCVSSWPGSILLSPLLWCEVAFLVSTCASRSSGLLLHRGGLLSGCAFFVLRVPCRCSLHLIVCLLAQVFFNMPSDISDEAASPEASGPYADAYGALDPPIRSIEVGVRINERSICFFDITSGHTIQDLLDASEDPGCASVTTCFRVTHITVHTTAIALGCAERPPDFITPPSSDDEM